MSLNLKEVMITGICPKCHKYLLKRNDDGDMECLCGFIIYQNGRTSRLDPLKRELERGEGSASTSVKPKPVRRAAAGEQALARIPIDTKKLAKGTKLHGMQRVQCNGCDIVFEREGSFLVAGNRSFHSRECMMPDGKRRPRVDHRDGADATLAPSDILIKDVAADAVSDTNEPQKGVMPSPGEKTPQTLTMLLAQLKRQQTLVRAATFERMFMNAAQSLLPKEVFDTVFKKAMEELDRTAAATSNASQSVKLEDPASGWLV